AMMWPRLELLQGLLAEDGSIWVSVDDREAHYLKVIMDEVFGRQNFLSSFIWKKSYGGGAKAKWFVGLHEYVNLYCKNVDRFPEMFLPPDPNAVKKYYKFSDESYEERGPYRLQPLATTSMDERPNLRYPITSHDGEEIWPEKQWQWSLERVSKALQNNEIVFTRKRDKISVSYKQYLKDEDGQERKRKPTTIIEGTYTQHGTNESVALFGQEGKFSFPKPEALIEMILEASTNPGDLVLDSFLGSGTTAAVAQKMGRRYIGIELGDHAVSHCVPRLRKVIDGEQGGISKAQNWHGGGGFRFYRLGPPVFMGNGAILPDIRFPVLAAHLWFAETGIPWTQPARLTPFLGVHEGHGYALLYNGILRERSTNGGNVLTRTSLATIRRAQGEFMGPLTVYGERTTLRQAALTAEAVVFKQTPYEVKVNP
ncbi:MAG: site-specific DNA-methyltransferase, partial [Synechococcus sp. SB0676_bin_10]|nr:site-specific DNA-methyltransferase [Synechococcus sp. SB0676_bin_10]